jgi:signal peptidase I
MTGVDDALDAGADASGTEPNPKPTQRKRRVALEWTLIIVVAVLASFLVRTFVFQTFYIPSSSMNPTLWKGDRIVVNKLSVEFGTINIGDILVFKAPPDVAKDCSDKVTDLVKRVIGLPGDRLYSKGNLIYVNGKVLDQKWTVWRTLGEPIAPTTVPAGHYFMMGDSHDNSCDSRTWGTVPRSDLIGKVFVRIWPLGSIKWF